MNREFDVTVLRDAWQKMPPKRRHTYFFVLLALITVAVSNFQDDVAALKRLIPETSEPPRITSQEVYPAPVRL